MCALLSSQETPQFWIGVASRDHVARGLRDGICQVCHGKSAPLKRMRKGDGFIYYSGKERFGKATLCQRFTAIGTIADDEVYRFAMSDDFTPFRRNVEYVAAHEAEIIPLIHALEFIPNKRAWGYPFRYGFLKISAKDFAIIAQAMGATFE
jgi:hypothetical protein